MLKLSMNVDGVEHMLKVMVERLSDLNAPLREFDRDHKRPAVDATFREGRSENGDAWAPLSKRGAQQKAARIAKAADSQSRALRSIGGKLIKEEGRAKRRLMRAKQGKAQRSAESAFARRKAVRAAFDALTSGNVSGVDTKVMQRLFKRVSIRHVKMQAAAVQPLGKIAQSITSTVQNQTLTIESSIKWSGVHNDGGTAGNGAKEPKRTFLEWTPEDFEVLGEMLVDYVVD